jgi:pyridoxamine 5'-phosphate oxidase family protein
MIGTGADQEGIAMSFTAAEIDYLASQPLARLSTTDADGQPDVVPVAFDVNGTDIWVGGPGESFLATRKVRNITAGQRDVALVVDDMVSFDPFVVRGIRIYGRADDPIERTGMIGPGWYIRIAATVSWSWNMEGAPAGAEWYPTTRRDHRVER